MIPSDGFNYNQCSFKPEDKIRIDKILSIFNQKFSSIGLDYYENPDSSLVDTIPYKHIEDICSWDQHLIHLENITYKMAVVKEFRMIKRLVEVCKEKIKGISENILILEENLRKDYSKIITNDDFFSRYFSYKDFKDMFLLMTSSQNISYNDLNLLKKENLFKSIRRKIIAQKANLHTLLVESEKSVVHINNIKKEDLKTFQLLRSEFFTTICEESLGIKIPFGKETQTEIIRPSHPLAKVLKLERTEIIYLTVSLEPINEAELSLEQVIEFNNGMKFEVTNNQQVLEKDMFYELSLDQLSKCNLIVPFFFSFIRCNLVKDQRSNYNKINDSSLIEDVNLSKKTA